MIDRTNAELEQAVRQVTRGRRFLTRGSGNGHGYLTNPPRELPPVVDEPQVVERIATATALCDEPEAPSGAWVDAEAELAAERNALRHAAKVMELHEIRRGLTVEARIADARRRAKIQHRNIRNDLFVIERMLERAGVLVPPAAIVRLEAVEALLDGPVRLEGATCG